MGREKQARRAGGLCGKAEAGEILTIGPTYHAAAEALKPWYRQLCKRPCFHDEYLVAFTNPKVTLVDCPEGVTRITEHGVVANGEEYEVDLIVCRACTQAYAPAGFPAGNSFENKSLT